MFQARNKNGQFTLVCGLYVGAWMLLYQHPGFMRDVSRQQQFTESSTVVYSRTQDGCPSLKNESVSRTNTDPSANGTLLLRLKDVNLTVEAKKPPVLMPFTALGELPSGLMKYPRPTYIPESRNPCFHVNLTNKNTKKMPGFQGDTGLRCLPLIYMAGFAKSGSTDLHQNIVQHQHIIAATRKEPEFWCHSKRPPSEITFGTMLKMYDPITRLIESSCFESVTKSKSANSSNDRSLDSKAENKSISFSIQKYQHGTVSELMSDLREYSERAQPCPLVSIDSSPMYLYEAIDWEKDPPNRNAVEPKVLAPHKLHHLLDCPKIIVLMRDPVERLFSDFKFFALGKNGADYFHQLVVNGIAWWEKCIGELPMYKCAFGRNYSRTTVPNLKPDGMFDWGDTEKFGHNGANRVRFSIYAIYIKKWLEVFPRKCFVFIKTEEYNTDPMKVLTEQVYPFLELEDLGSDALVNLGKLIQKGHLNKTPKVNFSMLPQTKQLLQDFYRPYNEELVKLLDDRRFQWF